MRRPRRDDDTVRISRPSRPAPRGWCRSGWLAAAGAVAIGGIITGMLWTGMRAPWAGRPPAAPRPAAQGMPTFTLRDDRIRTATEQQIRDHVSPGVTVFRFATDPRIVVLDFASLHQQGLMLDRVAALVEKAATPRGRVLTDAALDQAIRASGSTTGTYYYGHDYSAAALVRFFSLADAGHVALDAEEVALRRFLTQLGWFQPDAGGALISVPQTGADARVTYAVRGAILRHELAHGAYFNDPDYVVYVHRFWEEALTADEREAVRRFLAAEGYDPGNADLMQNEMQAYLMFTRDPAFFTPDAIGMTPARLAVLQAKFLQDLPVPWLRAIMDQAVPASPGG